VSPTRRAPEQLKAGLAGDLVASKPEERLGAGVPRADFAGVGDRERRVGGVFKKFEEVAVGDRSHPNHLRKRVKQPVAAQSGCRRG